jgi:hypothetical protein
MKKCFLNSMKYAKDTMHPILLFQFFLRVRAAPHRQRLVAAVRSLSPLRESNKTLSGARNVKSRQFLPLHFSYTYTQPNRGADTHPHPLKKKLHQVVPKKGVKILKRARIKTASGNIMKNYFTKFRHRPCLLALQLLNKVLRPSLHSSFSVWKIFRLYLIPPKPFIPQPP